MITGSNEYLFLLKMSPSIFLIYFMREKHVWTCHQGFVLNLVEASGSGENET